MPDFTVSRVNLDVERRILIGLIVSTDFCVRINQVLRVEYFTSEYCRIVARWVKSYFEKYTKAPGIHIQDIFIAERQDLRPELGDLISSFLEGLSEKYEFEEKDFNADYLLDQAQNYFKRQALLSVSERIKGYVLDDKIDKAEGEVLKFKSVSQAVSKWVNPFDQQFIEKVILSERNGLFSFPGMLGSLTGPLERSWLVAVMGPRKRGKSWWLLEAVVQALLQKLKVVYISLEMVEGKASERLFKRIVSCVDAGKGGIYSYPFFDCEKNQNDSCSNSKRIGKGKLNDKSYKPCDVCRKTSEYAPALFHKGIERKGLDAVNVVRKMKGFSSMYGAKKNLRMITYPAMSAGLTEIRRDLDKLEVFEDFVPDVIVIDYADILRQEEGNGLDTVGNTWAMLKNLAASRHVLVITATQSNRRSGDRKNVTSTDVAWDIRKVDHVDLLYELSQIPNEKKKGIMRVSVGAFRWDDYDEMKQVTVLQQLQVGQPFLDSEIGLFFEDEE